MNKSNCHIVFLCKQSDLFRESLAYFKAFEKICKVSLLAENNINGTRVLFESFNFNADEIVFFLYPDVGIIFENIHLCPYPTICFHIDTFVDTETKVYLGSLFDINVVFHPNFENRFLQRSPACKVITLSHAVELEDFNDPIPFEQRKWDIAFVGDTERPIYSKRKQIINQLLDTYNIVGYNQHLTIPEILKMYSNAKVVLNIPRDDYLIDANLRCFEGMGAGAALFTILPSELVDLGFIPEVEFVGFDESNILEKIDFYFKNIEKLDKIARLGYSKTRDKHTYSFMANRLIEDLINCTIDKNLKKNLKMVYNSYLYYFARKLSFKQSWSYLIKLLYMNGLGRIPFMILISESSKFLIRSLFGNRAYNQLKRIF